MTVRDTLLAWIDQFENDHYEFDVYGENVSVDLPRETVEKVLDISLLLCDRVVEAKDELFMADYLNVEESIRQKCKDDEHLMFYLVDEVAHNERLYGRYRDIESMITNLKPRDYPVGSAASILYTVFEIRNLIYAVIRHVDDIEEKYMSLAYTFFLGVLCKGWGEGFGWSKDKDGTWTWKIKD